MKRTRKSRSMKKRKMTRRRKYRGGGDCATNCPKTANGMHYWGLPNQNGVTKCRQCLCTYDPVMNSLTKQVGSMTL